MTTWSVHVQAAGPEGATVDEARLERLASALIEHAAAVAAVVDGYSAQLAVEATTARGAVAAALQAWRAAVGAAGLPAWEVVAVEVLRADVHDARLARPAVPELVGVTEVARVLGVSRQRVNELAVSERFPRPVARLAAGPVWVAAEVHAFNRAWARKPGPPKTSSA